MHTLTDTPIVPIPCLWHCGAGTEHIRILASLVRLTIFLAVCSSLPVRDPRSALLAHAPRSMGITGSVTWTHLLISIVLCL